MDGTSVINSLAAVSGFVLKLENIGLMQRKQYKKQFSIF